MSKFTTFLTACGLIMSALLLLFYSLTLLTGGWFFATLLTLTAVFSVLMFLRKSRSIFVGMKIEWVPLILLIYVLFLYFSKNLSEPMKDWDARAIWFFHSKIIYLASGMKGTSEWTHPSIPWSHPDYPKMVPILGAYLSSFSNAWNETLAKLSIWIMLLPAVFWLVSFFKPRFSYLLLALSFLTLPQVFYWNGYIDGLIALYVGCAALLGGRFAQAKNPLDLYSMILSWGVILSLKNEGMLIVLCLLISVLILHRPFQMQIWLKRSQVWLIGILSLAPFLIWAVLKKMLHIQSEFQFFSYEALSRVHDRVTEPGTLYQVFVSMFFWERNTFKSILLVLGSSLLLLALRRFKASPLFKISTVSAFLYCSGMFLIYLFTPYDMMMHIRLSVDRTMLSFVFLMMVALYALMNEVEDQK